MRFLWIERQIKISEENIYDFEIEQDENFSFISGYTSGGFPYGNPREKADDEQDKVEDVFV